MSTKNQPEQKGGAWKLLVDYGPLLALFVAYRLAGGGLQGALFGTLAFMIAMVIALIVAVTVLKRVPPILWLSGILVLVFGGTTLYLRDPKYIQMKPTAIYLLLAVALFIGLARRKAFLRWLFGPVFPGLSEQGWLKLSRNWAIFFLFLACANEIMRAALDFNTWMSLKVWGVSIVSVVFALANIPMLLRHGLESDKKAQVITETPVE